MLNLLGVVRTVTRGLRKIHTTFGGFGLYSLAREQIISRINTLFQHYHTPSNISKKMDMSVLYLQLQLGMPHNHFTLDYNKWGYLAPLSWVRCYGTCSTILTYLFTWATPLFCTHANGIR
jgi:hypothetical protein